MEYEIKSEQYITSSTTKNTNYIDAVEGTYYRKTNDEATTSTQIPELPTEDKEWKEFETYEESISGQKTTLHIQRYGEELYKFYRTDNEGYKIPLFASYSDKGSWGSVTGFSYSGMWTWVFSIEARLVSIVTNDFDKAKSYQIQQHAIGKYYDLNNKGTGYDIDTSTIKEVGDMDENDETSWRKQSKIQTDTLFTPKGFFDKLYELCNNKNYFNSNYFRLYSTTPIAGIDGNNKTYISFWSVCSMLGLEPLRNSYCEYIASTTTSISADDVGYADVIDPSGYYKCNFQTTHIDVDGSTQVDFGSEQPSIEIKYDSYKTQSAQFSLSDEESPKTKYTVPDTSLLTKVSYVQRYNEDGSLSSYKQPLFSEIADTIINNSKENKKTTVIEYIGTDNIQVGDTIYFTKTPEIKYIVTKTSLKANPFFVKTVYARQIL